MRFTPTLLPLISLASAIVIPDEHVFQNIEKSGRQLVLSAQNALDDALGKTLETVKSVGDNVFHKIHETGCDVDSWLEGSSFDDALLDFGAEGPHHPPHRKPSHHKPPHHRKPHHPPHHGKPNLTVYELISKSKYTTKLAKLIDEYNDLVEILNGTEANYTIFAPTDAAFEKIPEHAHKPSKEFLKNLLLYHVSDSFYPAGRVLHSYTIPTLYTPSDNLGHAQRLTVRVTLKGPAINFYSRIVAVNIFGTNGVIHGIDSILIPPPSVATIIGLLPGEFSTLELALTKTGLVEKLNSTEYPHEGGTVFAPSNGAFKKLGPKINAFLFSKFGQKYLKALLKYHIVVNQTLYTDAFFDGTSDEDEATSYRPPYIHYDLPTALDDKFLAIDVVRYGPFLAIKINGFSSVTIHDGVASDGVIQVVSNVLIPPKKAAGEEVYWKGEEMSVGELKERLEPFVQDEEVLEL
ncbi:FAS1 domain-containing protein [Melanomma pulvis-pyrius CBS 109.77]|uniref:FAS1 domain-containing protein n=1 Tax=Melanomma pulvis-pyrius CBS 109.77 TaxID=1314802 RepID=A0A6A6XBZ0_9PLEO|nr:FAS1 domain-containing protein [Melanomma pulvis-pyrius CBS 109.77]